ISDESPLVRFEAAKILIQTFPKREKSPLLWAIKNESSIYFFKKLIDLLNTYDNSQFKEIRENALNKIKQQYNLNSDDSKFVLDIDYLDYMKFKTDFYNFTSKFKLSDEAENALIEDNTEIGYKGLGRVKSSKNGYILELSLIDLIEIPASICKLTKLESLEISYCKLKKFPDNCPNLLLLKKLVLNNNKLDRLPRWVKPLADQTKYVQKYIVMGVNRSEVHILSIFEILTGRLCKKIQGNENDSPYRALRFKINNLGHITKIIYLSKEPRIGVFPEEICSLEFLEELTLIDQDIQIIPEAIGRLKKLKVLNLSYNKIKSIPESIKKLKNLELFYLNSDIKEH
ncbi:MAG: leucine-rich repeat domain-containing protein, partial [Candidatus Hermodarchaeota archaeon]